MGRRKIRNLTNNPHDPHQLHNKRSKCRNKCLVIFVAIIMTVVGLLIYYVDNLKTINHRLREHVDRQYNYHLYGKEDYCNQQFEPLTLTEPLKMHIINQNDALDQIIDSIGNLDSVVSLALVGSSGVGKTLTCNILQSNFQWTSNVLYFIWSSYQSKSSQYYKILNSVKKFSKKCGAYLVIIDNIDVISDKTIQELNIEIQNEFAQSDHSILVVYVFNLASYSDEDLQTLEEKRLRLQNMNGIKSIDFRSFERNDVERCIILEGRKLNISLSGNQVNEVFEYIDWTRSGCKLIHSKIVMYT